MNGCSLLCHIPLLTGHLTGLMQSQNVHPSPLCGVQGKVAVHAFVCLAASVIGM